MMETKMYVRGWSNFFILFFNFINRLTRVKLIGGLLGMFVS